MLPIGLLITEHRLIEDKLLNDFLEFDRSLIHKKYKEVVESYK